MSPHGGVIDRREMRTAKLLAYLLGWSLTRDGVPVPMALALPEQARVDTIRSLDPDRAVEIHAVIEAHEDATEIARAAQKKNPRWCATRRRDLRLAIQCGWRVEWVRALDVDDYDTLIELVSQPSGDDD